MCWIPRRGTRFRLAYRLVMVAIVGTAALPSFAAAQPASVSPADSAAAVLSDVPVEGVFTGAKGVVWSPPSSARAARFALQDMADAGVTAVRMTASMPALSGEAGQGDAANIQEQIWSDARALGIDIWLDLPLAYRSTAQLRWMDESVRPALQKLAQRVILHPAVRAIGLGTGLDTTDPETCDLLRTWASIVRAEFAGAESSQRAVYYVTPFQPEADVCASAVDGVLLDVRDRGAATAFVQAWREQARVPVAIGAAGTWVDPSAASGLSVPHSPQRQARELETVLTTWLPDPNDPLRPVRDELQEDGHGEDGYREDSYADGRARGKRDARVSVFVARWTDASAPLGRAYGVYTSQGERRPAADVLRGVYTGAQRVFALPGGDAPGPDAPWVVLFGWLIVGVLAVIFARRPLFRRATVRYFSAHAFYCDSVREGRETMPIVNVFMLLLVSMATGVIAAVVGEVLRPLMVTEHVVMALGPELGAGLDALIQRPVVAGSVVAGGVAVLLLLWAIVIGVVVRQWASLRADQVLMLVVWPCWPALLWMGAALVTASSGGTTQAAGLLALLSGAMAITATVRVVRDVRAVARIPVGVTLPLPLASPAMILFVIALGLWARYDVPVALVVSLFG
jgi:hypothetical protein